MTVESDPLFQLVWRELAAAVRTPEHPWRIPVLITSGDRADGRVVVLRRFETNPRRFTCFTDLRSPKIQALRLDSRVSWVFYNPNLRLQVRVRGRASVHHSDALARVEWDGLPEPSRREYAAASSPGTPEVGAPLLGLSEAFRNFAVILSEAEEWDCLQLSPDGHRRICLSARGVEQLVP